MPPCRLDRFCVAAVGFVLAFGALAQPEHAATFVQECVAADHPAASAAGASILAQGGNAVDAAVATSFTLSVVRPYSCGLGGGGFMVVYLPDHPTLGRVERAICYRERAPNGVGPDYYERHADPTASTRGASAVAIPGTVAGLLAALDRYGSMTRAEVLQPAIRAAEAGFDADAHYVSSTRDLVRWFTDDEARRARFAFVWERFLLRGEVRVGDRILVPEQARALRLIAEHGPAGFYEGAVGEAIERAILDDGGVLVREDLASPLVIDSDPLRATFMRRRILSMPPPSSGGVCLAQILGILDAEIGSTWQGIELEEDRPDLRREAARRVLGARASETFLHRVVEACKHAFADRATWLADPLYADVPWGTLLSRRYLRDRAATFDPARTLTPDLYGTRDLPDEPEVIDDAGTSHLSVVDRWGNAVACTETINLEFGSLVAVPEFGFVLNNEMDDFLTRRGRPNEFGLRQSERNLPEPGKAPLSSMTPTIVLDAEDRVLLVVGASGGPRIITGVLQAMLDVLVYDADAGDAVAAPRFHHQWMPDVLKMERGFDERTRQGLIARGHDAKDETSASNVQLIRRAGESWQAASDPRKGGRPAGR